MVQGLVAQMPASEQRVLGGEGAASILVVPIVAGGGVVGLHRARRLRAARACGPTADIDALRAVAQALGAAVGRIMQEETRRFSRTGIRSLVENGPAVTYIDAPDATRRRCT